MPAPIHAMVVDDEAQSRSLICKLISLHFPVIQTEEAGDVLTALSLINKSNPSLVFLDVQMRGETGFDLLDRLTDRNFDVIFTTAHSEFAVKAFRYSASDYLMKPIDQAEFIETVGKALQRINNKEPVKKESINHLLSVVKDNKKLHDKLTVPTADGFLFVTVAEILYCRAASNYTNLFLSGREKIVSSYNLGYYEDLLTEQQFFRVHRSCLINLAHVRMYKRGEGGSVIMSDGEEIEVSRANKDAFLKLFRE